MILAAAAHTRQLRIAFQIPWRGLEGGKCRAARTRFASLGVRMATILEFKSAPRPTAASVLGACGTVPSAEIVFFPGVRYERGDEEEEKSHDPKQRRHDPDLED